MTAQTKIRFRLFVLALSVFLISAPVAVAQTVTGTISGIVADPTGAVVPGVNLTLRNEETGVERSRQTNAAGIYNFVNVLPGTYQLSVAAEGFKSVQTVPFTATVNQSLVQDFTLEIGAVTETIEVTGEAELIQATSTELGTVITQQSVRDLPLNGRNFSQIMILTPGTTPVSTAQGEGSTQCSLCTPNVPGTVAIRPSVQGQWNRSNMFLLDGILNEQFLAGTWAVAPVIDSIQEFKVQSHNDKAEYGGVLGGTVNVVTKSGTNELHGSVWEFLRNDELNARDPFQDFGGPPAAFRFNQFGATVGGPVYIPKVYDGRNKTWFFFTYEGWRLRQASSTRGFVPTAPELSGDFSNSIGAHDIFDPLTTLPDSSAASGFIRTQFPNNMVPASRHSPLATQYLGDLVIHFTLVVNHATLRLRVVGGEDRDCWATTFQSIWWSSLNGLPASKPVASI